jgi:spore maturation protein CgeB
MKIFYSGLQYDHYDKRRGLSFEHNNLYLSLAAYPGAEVKYFPYDHILDVGKDRFNEELLEQVKKEQPNLVFFFMYSEELDIATLKELKKYTTTIAWFADDSWRFYNYSKFWAKHFTWAVTTYSWMPALYKKAGQPNVIRSQWAANTATYKPTHSNNAPDVAFVGGKTASREVIIVKLNTEGINAEAFGGGWPAGRISEEKMLGLFSNSKINLALNPPPGQWTRNAIGRLFFKPFIDRIIPDFHLISNVQTFFHQNVQQIKARHFEIPACGGFILTSPADDLDCYYEPGKEIVFYETNDELVEKVKYYLAHDDERKKVAKAAYDRTIKDHTYKSRFAEIFKTIGLER